MTETKWTRPPSGRPATDAEEFVLNLASEGHNGAQEHVARHPYLRAQARWAPAFAALNALEERRREGETACDTVKRLATRRSYCWGLRDGEWWMVQHRDGEPHTAYHQLYGRIDATRQSFERWTPGADKPAPVVVVPASTPANVAVSMCARLLIDDNPYSGSDCGRAYRDGVTALAADLTTPEDAPAETSNERRIAELETLVRNLRCRCVAVDAQASEREMATLEAEELQRQHVAGANRREARLRSQSEAWRKRAEVLEQAPRDVLEAAHELRLLGCEGEDAHEVMVDAARVLSESKTANVRLQVKVQRIGGALDRVRHTIAQELEAHELAMAEPRPPVG